MIFFYIACVGLCVVAIVAPFFQVHEKTDDEVYREFDLKMKQSDHEFRKDMIREGFEHANDDLRSDKLTKTEFAEVEAELYGVAKELLDEEKGSEKS